MTDERIPPFLRSMRKFHAEPLRTEKRKVFMLIFAFSAFLCVSA
jgi:hypothetical protein